MLGVCWTFDGFVPYWAPATWPGVVFRRKTVLLWQRLWCGKHSVITLVRLLLMQQTVRRQLFWKVCRRLYCLLCDRDSVAATCACCIVYHLSLGVTHFQCTPNDRAIITDHLIVPSVKPGQLLTAEPQESTSRSLLVVILLAPVVVWRTLVGKWLLSCLDLHPFLATLRTSWRVCSFSLGPLFLALSFSI